MTRSDVAVTTKGSMQVCRQVYAVSEKSGATSIGYVLKRYLTYTEIRCSYGGIGRHARLKICCPCGVPVQVRVRVPRIESRPPCLQTLQARLL